MENLSDRLDIIQNIQENKEEADNKKYEKWIKKLDKYIEKKFNNAKQILGNRLTTERVHESMNRFYFDINTNPNNFSSYLHFYICKRSKNDSKVSETLWELTCYDNYQDRKKFHCKNFKLKDLDKIIKDYVNNYFEIKNK